MNGLISCDTFLTNLKYISDLSDKWFSTERKNYALQLILKATIKEMNFWIRKMKTLAYGM